MSPGSTCPPGRRNRPPGNDPIPGINKPHPFDDRELTLHNHLRHLLQVGYLDREIGRAAGDCAAPACSRRR